jgi:hypothetical protein
MNAFACEFLLQPQPQGEHLRILAELLLIEEAGQLRHGVGPGGFGCLAMGRARLAFHRRSQRRVQPQVAVGQRLGKTDLDESVCQLDFFVVFNV